MPGAAFHPWALWGRWIFNRVLVISPSHAGSFTSSNSYKLINSRGTRDLLAELNSRFRKPRELISSSHSLILWNYPGNLSYCSKKISLNSCVTFRSSFTYRTDFQRWISFLDRRVILLRDTRLKRASCIRGSKTEQFRSIVSFLFIDETERIT